MASHSEPPYFEQARQKGHVTVSDPPKFDLEAYVANYKGRTRIHRLYHIGKTSSHLYLEALKAAVAEAKLGKDVQLYEQATHLLSEISPSEPEAIIDQSWIEKTKIEVKIETSRLEAELKGYKNNLIKESIRMGYDDLGRHFHQIGNLGEAAKAYSKEREYCQLPSHITIMIFRLINVYVDQESWLSVESNVQKLRSSTQKPGEPDKADAKLSAVMGLAQLATRNYDTAAISFLNCDPRMLQAKLDDPNDEEAYNEVLTPNDIATYGTLCALASMDRGELQSKVLDSSSFRSYLELEPQLRQAISSFVAGKYSACLGILESYRIDYLLDVYLSRHFIDLFRRIRNKAIIQYFVPFSCVTFEALASAFNTDEDIIVQSLNALIRSDVLSAHLDIENRHLVATKIDSRNAVHGTALATAKDYERTLQLRILRMEVLGTGLEVKAPKSQNILASQQGTYGGDTLMSIEPNTKGKILRTGRGFFG